jgi:transcriptional regulator with XRE-family HTH domain
MSKFNTSSLVGMLRERVGMERKTMLRLAELDEKSLRRIESEKQHPKPDTLEKLISTIDFPTKGFIYSILDYHPMEVCLLCDRLTQLLDIGDSTAAEDIITQLEALPGFDTGIFLQFILSKKTRLWELQGKPADLIIPLIDEGIAITYDSFDEGYIEDKVLILEESELLHTKARIYAKAGNLDAAIKLLEQMVSNLDKLPSADKEKERQYAPVLLSLSKCLLQYGECSRALEICELGAEYSASHKQGQLNPDFELIRAYALRGLNRLNECKMPLQHAYFGYTLLGETDKAKDVLTQAGDDFSIQFNLYGVDKLEKPRQQRIPYDRGEPVDCYTIGTMISTLRKRAGLTLEQLCRGICNKSTLLRVEQDLIIGNFFTLEAIMQRLGRDISLFSNFFLSKEEFMAMQLRDRILLLISEYDNLSAARLLRKFKLIKNISQSNIKKQFVKMVEASLFADEHEEPHPEFPSMLLDALRITYPQFDERNIDKYPLTYNEIWILNQYAGYFMNVNEFSQAAKIFERLHHILSTRYVDSFEKARMYSAILFNYSSCLGRAERWDEALSIISEGECFERCYGQLFDLPGFIFNRAYIFIMQGNIEKSVPYLALAYYGTSMFSKSGQSLNMPIIRPFVEEHTGIVFD